MTAEGARPRPVTGPAPAGQPAVVLRRLPEYWAEHTPDRPAVVDGEEVLSYADWNEAADRLASAIEDLAVGHDRIAVRMHQSVHWFELNLAIAKLRAEQVAINWRLTALEVAEAIADNGARLLVLDDTDPRPVLAALRPTGTLALTIGELLRRAAASPTRRYASRGPTPLVTYSSGTTGKARGVRGATAADPRRRQAVLEYLGLRPAAATGPAAGRPPADAPRTLLTLPLHHGIGPRSARSCHEQGGTVYLLDRYDPAKAIALIQRHRITHWTTVPTMLSQLRALPAELLERTDVSSMRMLALGSAPSSQQLQEWTVGYFGNCLYEGYGASEVGMVTLMRPRWRSTKPGSCGRLRSHVSVRICSPDGTELPRGDEGEIWVRTPVMIEGYLNEGPLDEQLLRDGYFNTGDVGRLDAEDFLYITGRRKDMIVAGGVNIFPAEIELALAEHPDVIEAAVFGIPEPIFGEQVMAVCQPVPGARVTVGELLEFVSHRLAAFKLPRMIELADELPRNAMGKVVKDELRKQYWSERDLAG